MSGTSGAAFLELFDVVVAAFLGLKGVKPQLRPDGIVICCRKIAEEEGQVAFRLLGRLIRAKSAKSDGV
jgi:hypothetical protein